jgi:ribosomal protein S11
MAQQLDKSINLTMDAAGVYREDVYTDRKVGTIRSLTPVKSDGTPDAGRKPVYVGEAQILTPMGAIPVTFEIDAATLDAAVTGYPAAAKQAVERTVKEIQEMRRQAASSIVIPQGGGLPPGGLGGGGKIQLP